MKRQLLCLGLLLGVAVLAWGCAFAPYSDGRGGGVLGLSIGPDGAIDTGGLGGGLATLLGIGGAAVGVPGLGLLVSKFVRAVAERAELRGKEAGWEAREQAATVQAPLPTSVAGPVAHGGGVPVTVRTETATGVT